MRRQCLLLVALGLAASIGVFSTLSAQAAPSSAPSARICDRDDNGRLVDCQPVQKRAALAPTPAPAPVASSKSILPFTYAYVVTGPVALYSSPADADSGAAPVRTIDTGYIWVRLAGQTVHNGQTWYLTDGGGYLPASITAIYRPSAFHGITLQSQPAFPFAWVMAYSKTSPQPGAKPEAGSAVFKRYDVVNIYEQRQVGEQTWYRVGENQWLIQTALAIVEWRQPPAEVPAGDKWIDVSLFEQSLAAYEGDRMVYATLVSSGLRQWPTVKGLFRIHTKITWGPMSGREGKPDFYSLEDVPWSMYFFEDYALHGAYWHDGFGYRHSHGCVNLPPLDSKWLYDWTTPVVPQGGAGATAPKAAPGTWVWVHD